MKNTVTWASSFNPSNDLYIKNLATDFNIFLVMFPSVKCLQSEMVCTIFALVNSCENKLIMD